MSERTGYGCLAEFPSVEALLAGVRGLRERGYTRLEAYTPFPIEGLNESLGALHDPIPLAMLVGGIIGGLGTLALQYYAAVGNYPIDVGGRPDASWPAFIPAALEMTVLFSVLAGVGTMLLANGLPRLNHPLFDATRFEAASRDGLFVVILVTDPLYGVDRARRDLEQLAAVFVETVGP
jgi:hypothetical protein